LTAGTTIFTPPLADEPFNAGQNIPFVDDDEVAIIIDGKRFRYWTTIRFAMAMDGFDEVQFVAPFDIGIPNFFEIFRPFSYKRIVITIGGSVLFTGVMVSVTPSIDAKSKTVSVSCYSLPAVLQDCTMPASSFPLEFNNQGLTAIATAIASPFGLSVEFQATEGAVFKKVSMDINDNCFNFLTTLAKQRNLIISNTVDGKLLFSQSTTGGSPVALLEQGVAPVAAISAQFDSQQYFSHITGIGHTTTAEFQDDNEGGAAIQYTVKNPFLTSALRPMSYSVDDTENSDLRLAVEAKIGRMFGNVASYELTVPTWRDSQGNLWKPNTTLRLLAPDAMIYRSYEFVIRMVSFENDKSSKTAKISLSIPGTFSGIIPRGLPWDI